MHDAVAFLTEANQARNQHLLEFQGNVEKWAANHQQKVETLELQRAEDRTWMAGLEQQLARAQNKLQWMAATVLLPGTPAMRVQNSPLTDHGSPLGLTTRWAMGSPLGIGLRRQRPPAVPLTPPGWAMAPPL